MAVDYRGLNLKMLEETRVYEGSIYDIRGWRVNDTQGWKDRIRAVDVLARGDFPVDWPDQATTVSKPMVMSLVNTALSDISRLVAESPPAVRCPPKSDSKKSEQNATLREGIATGYSDVNNWDILEPQLGMDLALTGAAFVAAFYDPKSAYPCWSRRDPRFCYPDVVNDSLVDLITLQTLLVRKLTSMYPQLAEDYTALETSITTDARGRKNNVTASCEMVEFFSKQECGVMSLMTRNGEPVPESLKILSYWAHELDMVPVGFSKLTSHDNEIRGMFDQIGGSLIAKNRIAQLLLDDADSRVYAPFESLGVLNDNEIPGPTTVYRLDPNVPNARMGRVPPASSAPELLNLMQFLDTEQRGGVSYPSTRQGEIPQSQGSASFVTSTMGQLTSTVRDIKKRTGMIRRQLNTVSFSIDEKYLNSEKPLVTPVGKTIMYTPKKDIDGMYANKIIDGAAAGLDQARGDVRILQFVGAKMMSLETASEQVDAISDPVGEQEKVQREQVQVAAMQKFLQEAPVDQVMQVYLAMNEGKSFEEGVTGIMEQMKADAAAAQAQQAQAAQTGPAPEGAATDQLALQQGQTTPPGAPAAPVEFAPPPLEQISVGGR